MRVLKDWKKILEMYGTFIAKVCIHLGWFSWGMILSWVGVGLSYRNIAGLFFFAPMHCYHGYQNCQKGKLCKATASPEYLGDRMGQGKISFWFFLTMYAQWYSYTSYRAISFPELQGEIHGDSPNWYLPSYFSRGNAPTPLDSGNHNVTI